MAGSDFWVMDSAGEVDAEIILHLPANARSDLRSLPPNVRLVDWLPMGVFLNGADGFIHHGGAGNTLTALHAGIPQIVFGECRQTRQCPRRGRARMRNYSR